MRTLSINKKEVQIPSGWNELSPEQVLRICTIYNNGGDVSTIKVLILLCLTGITITGKDHATRPGVYQVEFKGEKILIDVKDIAHIAEQATSFILVKHSPKGKQPFFTVSSRLIKNPIPTVNGLCGPSDALGNITWAEFCAAQNAYANYANTKHIKHLHKLIAILWRKPVDGLKVGAENYTGDLRQPYNDFTVDTNAARINNTFRANQLTAALLFYEGCLGYIIKEYPELFKNNGTPSKTKGDVFKNMLRLTLAAADNSEVKMKEVFDDPAHQVLFAVNEAIAQNKKMEEELKSKRHAA